VLLLERGDRTIFPTANIFGIREDERRYSIVVIKEIICYEQSPEDPKRQASSADESSIRSPGPGHLFRLVLLVMCEDRS
jgi:hypothetical protein